ncbi:UDP-3-O-(3-hydroxymyristoyl)glucosamine N-acyltransferase [Algisphaera agarilytica]|uniref:UDP-3-O-acylglucosamine N-acyltransferase n=1 Tax=Algisphaera agarilytica TaxID=1385975 RepID=A0A7X0LLB4_9BACT|nr:UDP-3-O-(3-hydroxymyristoyl)glucosamine N-acyltransferase [Algisphaera agarilytica]MBB6429813.1 UDP-3-O-[3-hydroxymyristoyl] glucosamine N-acyltransferase [Algisphaera agarilytica]
MTEYTPQTVAELLEGRLVGDPDLAITGLAEISTAKPGDLTFVGESGYAPRWGTSQASVAIVTEGIELEPGEGRALVFVENADLAMARVLDAIAPEPAKPEPGIHATAVVHDTAELGEDVTVGAYCVIGPGVKVGARTVLHNHVTLLDDVRLGEDCVMWPNVVIRERCKVGSRCIFEPGCIIGADGFGYRPDMTGERPRIVKIPHLGNVEIGDEVELGACVTIDRGKFDATTIGQGTKIDNKVQIGHNCKIGQMVVMSGCSAVAGSVKIGDGTLVGGAVIFRDHVTVGRGCKIAGGAGISGDIPDGEEWLGYNASNAKEAIRELMAIKKLPKLLKDFKALKQRVDRSEVSD